MRKYVLSAVVLIVAGSLALLTAQGEPKIKEMKGKWMMVRAESTMSVENVANGVVITITSENPEAVSILQNDWARRAANWNKSLKKKKSKESAAESGANGEKVKGEKKQAEKKEKK